MAITNPDIHIIIIAEDADWEQARSEYVFMYKVDPYIIVESEDLTSLMIVTPEPNDIIGWIHPSAKKNHKNLSVIIQTIFLFKKRRHTSLAEDFSYKMSQAGLIKI